MPDESVLVVDDSPTILKLVQLVLTKAGFRVITASSGEAGLSAAHEESPALILLDYLMPEMNGDDVCRAMSADTRLCYVPVVVMSSREDDVGERFARLINVVDHITKPFSPDALLAVISHTLDKRRARAEEAKPSAEFALHTLPQTGATPEEPAVLDAALLGDLAIISIADVLTLLQDQAQTGTLTLTQVDARLAVFLRNGRIDFATAHGVADEFLLGRFIVEAGETSEAVLAAILEERQSSRVEGQAAGPPEPRRGGSGSHIDDAEGQAAGPPEPRRGGGGTLSGSHIDDAEGRVLLGADLIARGLLTPGGLRKAMSMQTSALVYEGLRWGSGRFRFDVTSELPTVAREAALALPVDALIMEGLRRVDEWRLIEREIGDFEMIFVRNEEKLASFGRGKLLRDETAVLEFVNGKNSVKDIIFLAKLGSFDVTKMLYRLLRNKLIRRRVNPIAV